MTLLFAWPGRIWLRFWLWWRYERRPPRDTAEAIRHIREHFAALGNPIDFLSDEDLARGIVAMGEAARAVGWPNRSLDAQEEDDPDA